MMMSVASFRFVANLVGLEPTWSMASFCRTIIHESTVIDTLCVRHRDEIRFVLVLNKIGHILHILL
jgi:hypothetical protein